MSRFDKENVSVGYICTPNASNLVDSHNKTDSVSSLLPFVSSELNSSKSKNLPGLNALGDGQHRFLSVPRSLPSLDMDIDKSSKVLSYIDTLPFEIRLQITNYLSQYDILNLIRVNKSFFKSGVYRLYQRVVVDTSYSLFNLQVERYNEDIHPQTTTFIKLKHSFKSFLRALGEPIPVTFGYCLTYGGLVGHLQIINLPDGYQSPLDLNMFTFVSIKRLENLKSFYWNDSKELSFEFLERLPNKSLINSMNLKLDLKKPPSTSDFKVFKSFKSIRRLSVETFSDSFNLFHIIKNILEAGDNQLDLELLRLSRFNSKSQFIKNPPTAFLVLTDYILENESINLAEYDMNCVLNLFILFSAADIKLKNLKLLSLDTIVVSTADAKRFNSIINLSNLVHLELINITEVHSPENIHSSVSMNELCTRLDGGFLKYMGKKLVNLKRLYIDYRESLRDSVPSFIENLRGLEDLDVTIRWNITKLCSVSSWRQLCQRYFKAIFVHSTTLKKLSLETKEDSVFSDFHKLIFTDLLLDLQHLTRLESLRVHGFSLQPFAPQLVFFLKNLKYFELFGSGSGESPHLGLQVVHDGVLDEWLRVQHVAAALNEKNRDIEFIKIDRCIFEVQNKMTLIPRDGLENWFNSKVRVSLQNDDF